ncbi:MAG TPA: AMP-binding protein [Mycobacteriales bacterium]|nr:AMP-binding protein [Mycobacteriales bacterium]
MTEPSTVDRPQSTADEPRTLSRQWALTRERVGDHPALWFDGRVHGSGELFDRATRLASGLAGIGIRPGDRVAVLMANCPEVSITYHAIWRAGAAVTPVIFLVTAVELGHLLRAGSAAAVVTTADLLPKVLAAADGLTIPLVVLGPDPADPRPADPRPADPQLADPQPADPRLVDYAALEAAAPGGIADRDPDDLAALLFTGGTTGRSKGVPLTHANLWYAGWSSRQRSYVPGVVRGITALPLSHAYGILVTVGGLHTTEPLFNVLQRWFDPASWPALAAEHRLQVAAVVPSMLAALLAQPLERHDLSALRHVFSGAAPLAPALAAEFERRVPSALVLEGYGLTESGGIVSGSPPDRRRPGTVGLPVPGVDVRIADDLGADVPPGDDGEILVRGRNVMAGYWADPQSPAGTDGWLRTGDIGRLDADGYLTVVDRKKDLIIRGGYNVYPRDVEDVLLQHPAVTGAAVVGRPHPRLGEEVVAFVTTTSPAPTPGALIDHTRTHLAAYKYPREIHLIDSIPLTPVGKLDRKQLRHRLHPDPAPERPGGPTS